MNTTPSYFLSLEALFFLLHVLTACQPTTAPPNKALFSAVLPIPKALVSIDPSDTIPLPIYSWLDSTASQAHQLVQQIPVPEGYAYLPTLPNSFEYWLRHLPLHPKGTPILLYNGVTKPYQAGAYRVLNIDVGRRDLQQCADAVMRLRAEYLYSQKAYDDIHFNYTSGHIVRFSDWSQGKRPKVSSSQVHFSAPHGTADVSYAQFKRYLTNIFSYAGTASLSKELSTKPLTNLEAGDVFIQGGFPGHAVVVIAVVQHPKTGERLFMLAQSYMPAQSIHILNNPTNAGRSPWYSNAFTGLLQTPEWTFDARDLRQFGE